MDFFEYANIVLQFLPRFDLMWLSYVIGGACFLVVYAFQAVGLYTIAKNNGYNKRWMAFIPFFNTYYLGVLGDKNKFMGLNTRIISMIAAIAEFLLVVAYAVFHIGLNMAIDGGYVELLMDETTGSTLITQVAAVPAEMAWSVFCAMYLGTILSYVSLVYELLLVAILMSFFQTYAARQYMIFTITSVIFPIQGILIFVIMNNKGMNYRDYINKIRQQQYQAYQAQYRQQQGGGYNNPYNNPYQGGMRPPENGGTYADPYSGENPNPTPQPKPEAEDPFDGLGANPKPKDPFDTDTKN